MKLCVVIPALNEAATIARVIGSIPRVLAGIDEIAVVVVDDGSTDGTRELAQQAGAVVVSHPVNRGVGRAFQTGVIEALRLGADLMVNIDADGQFDPAKIPLLLDPLLRGEADFVTVSRFANPEVYPEMTRVKFHGNRFMTWLVGSLTGGRYTDVSCGFRAYTRDTLLHLNLFGDFTYTQETFLDLSFKGLRIVEVPMKIRGIREVGKSRVASNIPAYAMRSVKIIFRAFRDYRPMRVFGCLALVIEIVAVALASFLLAHYLRSGSFTPHKWAGFTAAFLAAIGLIVFVIGLVGDMLARVRLNQERILYLLKRNGHQ